MLDMRAKRLQLFDKLLVAALDVMDSRNLGRPVGDQARYDEGRSAAQIGRGYAPAAARLRRLFQLARPFFIEADRRGRDRGGRPR